MDSKTLGELIAESLVRHGVRNLYGIIGTSVVDFYDILLEYRDKLDIHTTRHEQAAASAADANYRVSKKPGAAVVHAGPGFLNTLISLGIAAKDRVPFILISGGVRRRLRMTDAWLEVPQDLIAGPLVKSYQAITDPGEAGDQLLEAFKAMYEPPMGPVVIEVAEDLWKTRARVPDGFFEEVERAGPRLGSVGERDLRDAYDVITGAEKPAILVSGEAAYSPYFSWEKLEETARRVGAYILTTGNSRGACRESGCKYCLGRVGFGGGSLPADKALEETDALLVLGNEFDDITTYAYTLLPRGDILVFSRDPWVKRRPRYYDLVEADPVALLNGLYDMLKDKPAVTRDGWDRLVEEWRAEWRSVIRASIEKKGSLVNPNLFFHLADQVIPENRIVTAGQGTHIVYTYNHLTINRPGSFLAATNLGAMGYALPAAIGAAHSSTGSSIVSVVGDGEIMMVVQELETIRRTGANVKIVVVNDNSYRVLYLRQVLQKQGRVHETLLGNPDFKTLAESFGIPAVSASTDEEARKALRMLEADGPGLVEIRIDKDEIPPLNTEYTLKMNAV